MTKNKIKTVFNIGKRKLLSKKDEFRLKRDDSIFSHYKKASQNLVEKIKPVYREYVNKISTPEMAVSLQTAVLLYYLSEKKHPKRILDLGSGFSSYILRSYAKEQNEHIKVYSIDDNKEWLIKTQKFLSVNNLSDENLVELKAFNFNSCINSFDLVFHDLGNMKLRAKYLNDAVNSCRILNGTVVLDDIQKKKYRNFVESELSNYKCSYYMLDWITRDDFGRKAALITGINPSK